ncbi:MAG: hypothetical protein IPL28_13180 [Chloroflexi bacterium]|nr:hypothetical protein [Chloroflexota bacterium]
MRSSRLIFAIFLFAIVATCGFLWISWPSAAGGTFYPQLAEPTPVGLVNAQPIPLSFADLNADPYGWRNRLLSVSGNFTRLSPIVCVPYKGVRPRWGLVNEGLKMDAVGLDELLDLVPDGGLITIEGVWRLYEGPIGCGKEPARGMVWYLEAKRIVSPNPLAFEPNSGLGALVQQIGSVATITPTAEGELPSPEPVEEGDPTLATPSATPTLPSGGTAPTTGSPSPTPTPSPTARSGIATPGRRHGRNRWHRWDKRHGHAGAIPHPYPNGHTAHPHPGGSGGGLPTTAPGTVIPATPIATNTPNSYGGGSYP